MSARAPEYLPFPLFASTNTRINLTVYSDQRRKTTQDINGKTVTVWLKSSGGSWKEYSVTAISAALGTCYMTVTGASHTTTGDASIQVHVDGVPKNEYTVEFRTKAS